MDKSERRKLKRKIRYEKHKVEKNLLGQKCGEGSYFKRDFKTINICVKQFITLI